MELHIPNLNSLTSRELGGLIAMLDALRAHRDGFVRHAQPEVAQNTGSPEPAPPFTGDPAGQPESAVEDSPSNSSTAPAVTEQKRGRGRPRKETAQESPAPAVEEQAPAAPAQEAAPITIDDLRAALQVFTAKNGIEAGMPLLAKYNARRISEMAEQSEEAKAAFIKECQA